MWGGKSLAWWKQKLNPVKTKPVLPPKKTVGEKAFDFALTQVGEKENPPNSNHTKYGVWYGLDEEPWCDIFLSYCFANTGYLGFKYALVAATAADALAGRNHLSVTMNPVRGDLVSYTTAEGPNQHIAFFDAWKDREAGTFTDLGGNTGQGIDVNANGGEVIRQERRVGTVTHFIKVNA